MLRRTASAVPRYHSATRPRAMYGWSSLTPPLLRSRSHGRPEPDVVVERARVVLGQDDDVVDVRVDAVRQREVDDPVLAAERDGRLGALLGQDRQALALAAGKDHRHRPLHGHGLPPESALRSLGFDASTGAGSRARCQRSVNAVTVRRHPPRPPQRNSRGFTKSPLSSTIQWRCAPVAWPVLPL